LVLSWGQVSQFATFTSIDPIYPFFRSAFAITVLAFREGGLKKSIKGEEYTVLPPRLKDM